MGVNWCSLSSALARVAGRHPGQRLDVGLIGLQQVVHQRVGLGLGFRREIARDIQLAQRLAHQAVQQMHAAGLAVELLGAAAPAPCRRSEIQVVEAAWADRPRRCAGNAPSDNRARSRPACGLKMLASGAKADFSATITMRSLPSGRVQRECCLRPGRHPRRNRGARRLQRRNRHGIVDLVLVAAVGAVPLHLGDLGFQRQHACRRARRHRSCPPASSCRRDICDRRRGSSRCALSSDR